MKYTTLKIIELGDMPVTLDEVKHGLGIEVLDLETATDFEIAEAEKLDAILTIHIAAATKLAENYCNRVFTVGSSIEYRVEGFTYLMDLPKQISAVDEIKFFDANETLETLDPDFYRVNENDFGSGFIELLEVPDTYNRRDAVRIRMTTGSANSAIKAAVVLTVEQLVDGSKDNEQTILSLLNSEMNPFI